MSDISKSFGSRHKLKFFSSESNFQGGNLQPVKRNTDFCHFQGDNILCYGRLNKRKNILKITGGD